MPKKTAGPRIAAATSVPHVEGSEVAAPPAEGGIRATSSETFGEDMNAYFANFFAKYKHKN